MAAAIKAHDTPALFKWLVSTLSFQGISDGVAEGFIKQHGQVDWNDVERSLDPDSKCPLLKSYWHFDRCGYRKDANTCSQPHLMQACGLPAFPLRNGRLNQTAFSLYLFIRDVADGDLIGWLETIMVDSGPGPAAQADALLDAFRGVFGVADKTASMVLSSILLGTARQNSIAFEVGSAFVVVDTLVHNFLHRTGVLGALAFDHPYGAGCYSARGCAQAIRLAAAHIDARVVDASLPRHFPRMVQHSLWRFCAEREFDICNGNRVKDGQPCANRFCCFSLVCKRIALPRSAKKLIK